MDLVLSGEDAAFRAEVRAFIAATLTPALREGQAASTGSYPDPAVSIPWQRALQARGWLVPLWPREWGGTGWTGLQRFIFENECALAGAPLVHPMGVRYVGPVIIRFGTDAQKREFLPRILSSEDYWCQGFSEPDAGSDLASLSLKAVREGDHYVLTGTKLWTTHAQHANRMFVLARTSREARRQDGISFLLVDMEAPGLTVRPIDTIAGDHDVNEVHFDGVRVPCSRRVGPEGGGWACARHLLEFERGAGVFSPRLRTQLRHVASVVHAMADPPADVLVRLGELASGLDAFEWLELRTLAAVQPGEAPGPDASILKLASSRLRQSIAQLGMQALGRDAQRWRNPAPRIVPGAAAWDTLVPAYLNSRAYTIFGGAAEIQLGLIARAALARG